MKKRLKLSYQTVPVTGGFMITSMLGLIICTVYTLSGRLDHTWGFTLILFFVIMFIASVVSMTPTFPKELNPKR